MTYIIDYGATGIKADVIAESTAAAGVTVDGLVIKDGDIYFPKGLGGRRRLIDHVTISISDDFHFRSGTYPTGWTWQTTGIWSVPAAPAPLPSYLNDYLVAYNATAFFADDITTFLSKSIYARFVPGNFCNGGLRLQADDTHYYQIRVLDLTTGLAQIYVDYDDGAGVVASAKSTVSIHLPITLRLLCLQTGANHYGNFYTISETGQQAVRFVTTAKTWTPAKVGFFTTGAGPIDVDWIISDFT